VHEDRNAATGNEDILVDMHNDAEQMSRLVDELLLLAQADSHQHLRLEPTRLGPIVASALRSARALDGEVLLQAGDLGEDVWLLADPDRLHQVVLILLDNALKYTPAGGSVQVRTSLASREDRPGVEIEVVDSGPGVPVAERERIFQRFYRAEAARQVADGAGLGLAVARWIVDEHGGQISVRAAEPSGSIFGIWLPTTQRTV
jgi:signal transduction histidine kinase